MPYVLAKLKGVKFEDIKKLLKEHAPMHAKEGMYLKHIWQNADDFSGRINAHLDVIRKNPQPL